MSRLPLRTKCSPRTGLSATPRIHPDLTRQGGDSPRRPPTLPVGQAGRVENGARPIVRCRRHEQPGVLVEPVRVQIFLFRYLLGGGQHLVLRVLDPGVDVTGCSAPVHSRRSSRCPRRCRVDLEYRVRPVAVRQRIRSVLDWATAMDRHGGYTRRHGHRQRHSARAQHSDRRLARFSVHNRARGKAVRRHGSPRCGGYRGPHNARPSCSTMNGETSTSASLVSPKAT